MLESVQTNWVTGVIIIIFNIHVDGVRLEVCVVSSPGYITLKYISSGIYSDAIRILLLGSIVDHNLCICHHSITWDLTKSLMVEVS